MIGFLIALALFCLQLWVKNELLETAFVNNVHFLFWWYVATGVVTISLAALVWAGDLGVEGARLRYGISSSLGWMLGLARVPLQYKRTLYFLLVRRLLMGAGVFLLMRGLQPAGATFAWDEGYLWVGGIVLGVSLLALVFVPLVRKSTASANGVSPKSSARPMAN